LFSGLRKPKSTILGCEFAGEIVEIGESVEVFSVGKSTFGHCKKVLKPEGIYMSTELGPYAQNPFLALLTKFYGKQRVLFPLPENTKQDADYLTNLMEIGVYKPVVDKSYPLDDIAEAFRYVETGMKIGNVAIKIV
jgi:NADPH:quinone reductase-like Zn-dependent oxidoreductase